MINRLFPSQIDNRFEGHRSALWLLGLLVALKLVIGFNSIFNTRAVASGADGIFLDGFDAATAQQVLTLFALNAFGQLVFALVAVVALVRWRALVPFLFLVWFAEQVGRRFIVAAHNSAGTQSSEVAWYLTTAVLGLLAAGLVFSLTGSKMGRQVTTAS